MARPSFLRVILRRNFLLFAFAQTISQFGDRLNNMALIGLIGARVAGSPMAFTQIAVFAALPVVIFSPVAGVMVDRLNRKWVLVGVDAIRTLVVAAIPTLFYITGNLLLVNLAVFSIFLLGLFFNSAKMAVLPGLVRGKEEYMVGNAAANFVGRFATLLGLLFGGLVVDLALWSRLGLEGWRVGFYLDSATYLLSAIFMSLMVLPAAVVKPRAKEVSLLREEASLWRKAWDDLRDGVCLIRRRLLIKLVLLSYLLLVAFMGAVYGLLVMHVQQVAGLGTKGVGFLGSLAGLGLIGGAYLVGRLGHRREFPMILWGLAFLGVLLALSGFITDFRLLALFSVSAGAAMSGVMISQDTLLHRMVSSGFRGRVFSVKEMSFSAGFALVVLALGSLGEFLKIFLNYQVALKSLLVGTGALLMGVVLWMLRVLKRWARRYG